jgi:hypothetical protein
MNFEAKEQTGVEKSKPEYLKVLAEIEDVLGKTSEEQSKYVEKRLDFLSNNAESGSLSLFGKNIRKGFLGPEMKIYRSAIVDPLILDDIDLYKELLESIKKFKLVDGWKEKSLREIILNAIQWTLSQYFGNIDSNSETAKENMEFHGDRVSVDNRPVSIKEFRGKGIAVCAEKGAAAQNLLAFVGLESDIVVSDKCRLPADKKEDAHYYILLYSPNGQVIYDPTNPKMFLDKDGKIENYLPAAYPVTKKEADSLISGASVTVKHADYQKNEIGRNIPIESERLYAGPKIF